MDLYRNNLLFILSAALTMALALSCNTAIEPEEPEDTDGYHALARMSVPCGTQEVMVESYALDAKGNKMDIAYQKVAVTPRVETPEGGKDVEPFGEVDLLLIAPNPTMVSVYYTVSGTVTETKSAATEDRTRHAQYVVERLPVDQPGKGLVTKASDPVTVYLPEPAHYVTTDPVKTVYQSSGVVFFEDSWPKLSGSINDEDYNDVVVDYDITAEIVNDSQALTGSEQLKVVLHVRAVSGDEPHRVGMVLEGFDMSNVETVLEAKTLDSYGSGHGELPSWTKVTLQENSLHYDPLSKEYPSNDALKRPAIEIGKIDIYNNDSRGAGTETYIYRNNGQEAEHVMNPARRQYAAWGGAHTEQYSAELPDDVLQKAQRTKYYNVVPGYVNVAGGLYTYTVIYVMKGRAKMTKEKSEEVKKNMLDAVVNTTHQNFYIVKSDYTPVGLKGYAPYNFLVKNYSNYADKYQSVYEANKDNLSSSTYYMGKNGEVWGFKCPTLTKHVWNKLGFGRAYPHYTEWVSSNGASYPRWYVDDVQGVYLTCWW